MKEKKTKELKTWWQRFLFAMGIAVLSIAMSFVLVIGVLFAITLFSDDYYLIDSSKEKVQRFRKQSEDDIPDRAGYMPEHNPNINQNMKRAKDWKQIVKNSEFPLGEFINGKHYYYQNPKIQINSVYPVIDGSTVMIPLAIECVRQHWGTVNEENEFNIVQFSTTHTAYVNLFEKWTANSFWYVPPSLEGSVRYGRDHDGFFFDDFKRTAYWVTPERPVELFLGTAPSPEELLIAERNGVTPVIKPICWDAFVFITHKNNPVNSLTIEQLQGIFSGKITNWKEVGGRDEDIRAFQREPGSGSQTGMEELVMRGVPMASPETVLIIEGMSGLVERVAEYKNKTASIGYTYRYYIDRLYKNDNIKTIAVEGVAPTYENIRSGKYPLSVNYVGVIRGGEEEGPGGLFLDWLLSEEGQACVKQAGYIPITK